MLDVYNAHLCQVMSTVSSIQSEPHTEVIIQVRYLLLSTSIVT